MGVLQKIFANAVRVEEMAIRVKGLQESLPLCCLCKTLSEEELEERMLNGF